MTTTFTSFNLDYAPGFSSYVSVTFMAKPGSLSYSVHYDVTDDNRDEEIFSGKHSRKLSYQGSEIWNDSAKSEMLTSLIDDLRAACKACKYDSVETMKAVHRVIDVFRSL